MNDAFLSVVNKGDKPNTLRVRARVRGDIERVFPDADVWNNKDADYAFAADVDRDLVSKTIAERIDNIEYNNFKNSVKEHDRHIVYLKVWSVLHDFQIDRLFPIRRQTTFHEEYDAQSDYDGVSINTGKKTKVKKGKPYLKRYNFLDK
jgi:hypothetical protein